jgi:hypothetical protein
MNDTNDTLNRLRGLPRAVLLPIAGFVIAAALITAVGFSRAGKRAPGPSAATSGATAAQPAAPAAKAQATLPVATPAASAPAVVILPGTPKPNGLQPQRAMYSIAVAQQRAGFNKWSTPIPIGGGDVEARASSFGSLPVPSLNSTLPAGRATEAWTFQFLVQHEGQHVFLLRLTAKGYGAADATVAIDGQAVSVASADRDHLTAAGTADLGAGWHQVVVTLDHVINADSKPGSASATLFVRGPDASAPRSVVPYAQAPAASAPAVASSATAPAQAKLLKEDQAGGAK